MAKNINIGYGDSATGCLLEAIEKHGLAGDGAIPSRDDFTQGPISECVGSSGFKQRIDYWNSVNDQIGISDDVAEFYMKSIKMLDDLKAERITIWVGDSCHDILATAWLLSYLSKKNFEWHMVNLAEVQHGDLPKGLPVVNLAMYSPKEVGELYKYCKPLSSKNKNYFDSIWQKVCAENSHYRIKKSAEILSVNDDFFDAYILNNLTYEFETINSVLSWILRDAQWSITDTTIAYNIRKMIDRKWLEYEGDLSSMDTFSIRKKKMNDLTDKR